MEAKKIEGLLGMAQRAGKTASGEFAIQKAIASGKVRALIVAEDASGRFKETMMKEAAAKGIPVYTRLTKDALGQCLGKEYRAAAAILDLPVRECRHGECLMTSVYSKACTSHQQ